ncbi:hypothetical protein lerEdw1_004983 [Lerista edwardsae]|nr:hypothetical protein lerEdw1_004983 [Lerista edwardsae]
MKVFGSSRAGTTACNKADLPVRAKQLIAIWLGWTGWVAGWGCGALTTTLFFLLDIALGALAGAGLAFFGIPAAVGFLGFTAGGILTGSLAAKMMSFFASISGGGVTTGGIVALLQSIGMPADLGGCCRCLGCNHSCNGGRRRTVGCHLSMKDTQAMYALTRAVVGTAVGAGVVCVGVPAVVGVLGFTAGGIAAGSVAAKMMSAAAIANGGGVAAGSTIAVLQSLGAAGLSAATKFAVTAGAAALGAIAR